jgi:hypothetical protein
MINYLKEEMETINRLVDDASDRAIYIIKREARKILREDPNLDEFIMAMGSCFFTIKQGGKYDMHTMNDEEWETWCESDEYVYEYDGMIGGERSPHDGAYEVEFFEMTQDMNELFKVYGYPVRFTANGKEVHDW